MRNRKWVRLLAYVTGSVTRKDGHHPIIFMQCGPIRFNLSAREAAERSPFRHVVLPRPTGSRMEPEGADRTIQDAYAALVTNEERDQQIGADSPLGEQPFGDHREAIRAKLSAFLRSMAVEIAMMNRPAMADFLSP